MALSNKERQARWRARLKARAEAKLRIEDVLREHMRALLLTKSQGQFVRDEDAELREVAAHVLLKHDDADLMEVVNSFLIAWRDEEVETLRQELQREAVKSTDWRVKR